MKLKMERSFSSGNEKKIKISLNNNLESLRKFKELFC